MDPGIDKMMELEKKQRMRARLPPREDVVKAIQDFVRAKKAQRAQRAQKALKPVPLEDTHATLLLNSMRFLKEDGGDKDAVKPVPAWLSTKTLLLAAKTLHQQPTKTTQAHVELAQILCEGLAQTSQFPALYGLRRYCEMLCSAGHCSQARRMLIEHENATKGLEHRSIVGTGEKDVEIDADADAATFEESDAPHPGPDTGIVQTWCAILRGFANQNDMTEVMRTLAMMRDRHIESLRLVPRIMLYFAIDRGDILQVQAWWREYWHGLTLLKPNDPTFSPHATQEAIAKLLNWCVGSDHLPFGHEVVREVTQTNPPKPLWDAIFAWAAGTGKGADEISRMIDVMERANQNITDRNAWRVADVETINHLIEFAISKDDPYMAERFIALGRERNIQPDARTYVLQIDYRLSVNDVDGALIAYKHLQSVDVPSNDDVSAVNRLIVALCTSKRHDFDTIMNVAADLSDRQARFEALTVATLSIAHLSRDELHDTIDLLKTHAFHYGSAERASILNAIASFCLDPATPTSRAWDSYIIIRSVFDEMAREQRTEIMTSFFKRDRPDMAVHIFNHMRAHSRADTFPTTDTYVTAFLGSARLRDLESLEIIHNQLKLDYNINLSTYIRNALIIAYTKCGKPRKGLGFWDDIVASKEGPSYNSIRIAFRACERSPFGDLKAKEIWEKLGKMQIELDSTLWASYIAALAGNGNVRTAVGALEAAEGKGELEVDHFVLGSLYTAAPGHVKQSEVEAWAKDRYPQVWAELEKVGQDVWENGDKSFKIDRSVTPS